MTLKIERLSIPDVVLVTPPRSSDARGWFSETYNQAQFADAGLVYDFVQDNHSSSEAISTLRGLHYQSPPYAQTKLVRVVRGAIIDVAVDARRGSPYFGKWVKAELSADNGRQIIVPKGFLHGFVTLEPFTEVTYKVDQHYSHPHDGSVRWDDPDLAIDWELGDKRPVLSDKDSKAEAFASFDSPFDMSSDT